MTALGAWALVTVVAVVGAFVFAAREGGWRGIGIVTLGLFLVLCINYLAQVTL